MKRVKTREAMTSRERVIAAVKGLPTDRVPVMYWLNPHAAARLIAEFQPAQNRFWNLFGRRAWKRFSQGGPYSEDVRNALPLLLQVYANSDYVLELGADMADIPFGSAGFWGRVGIKHGRIRARDAFGCLRGMCGIYLEVIRPAIREAKELVNYCFPDATHERNYAMIRKFRAKHPEVCIFADNFGVQDLFSTQIWEMSRFMMALYDYPDEVKEFQRRFADWMIDIARRSVNAGADIIFIYDDYGYTGRPLISMDMWKEFTYPHLKRQIEAVHNAGAIAMLHSCGFQMPFLQYYVDAELDVLQSLQPKAGNEFKEAYEKYGDRLAFSTGIDVQQGDYMSPEELRQDILRSYHIGGRRGRHILGMTHMMQYTMPAENIRALYDTVREIQAGEHDTEFPHII
jgi:uroporphyrinogen decarboxylase